MVAFVAVALIAVALPLLFRFYDYNRFIQIPYWTVWSYCYLFPESTLNQCSAESLHSLSQWTREQFRWELEEYQPGQVYAVPELKLEEFSYENLGKVSKGFTLPVVVRGLFKGTKAQTTWSHEFFADKYGENILVTLSEGRPDKQYATGDTFKGSTGGSRDIRGKGYQNIMKPVKMKIKNALKYMSQGEKLYISNVDTIFRRNNDLLDDLEFNRVVNWAYEPYVPYAAQIFLGYGSKDINDTTGTLMHSAASANLFLQVKGGKDWTLLPPRYSIFIQPSLGFFTPAAKAAKKPSDSGVPLFKVSLNEGDMLFNPPWMWHEVKNREGLSVGVATRENHPTWIVKNNWLFSALLEIRATPRVAKLMIPENQKALRFMTSIPYLTFAIGLVTELIKGPGPHPVFTAAFNPCDEHDPNGCTTTFLDKTVYSDDVEAIPYRE
mmetsp:Transcript_11266/g.12144  ORF Transcript_11266/g.12144 Transcript_11266/m.12144 type:complete len:437 (+) Transcript_11266:54-1364(+)